MRIPTRSTALLLGAAALANSLSGCVWIVHRVDVKPVPTRSASFATTAPVKVHLSDGSTVMYRQGVTIASDTLRGTGERYDRTVTSWSQVTLVPADSVAAIEVFDTRTDGGATALVTGLTTAVVIGGIAYAMSGIKIGPAFSGPVAMRSHP